MEPMEGALLLWYYVYVRQGVLVMTQMLKLRLRLQTKAHVPLNQLSCQVTVIQRMTLRLGVPVIAMRWETMLEFLWFEIGSVLWSSAQDDGLMIKCGICKLWQHAICFGFLDEEAVPDLHVCTVCSKVTLTTSSHKQSTQAIPSLTPFFWQCAVHW